MKKLFLISILVSGLSFGQIFSTQDQAGEVDSESNFFKEKTTIVVMDEPDQGVDGIGNPGDPAPINDWMLILPVIAIGIGIRYYRKHKEAIA